MCAGTKSALDKKYSIFNIQYPILGGNCSTKVNLAAQWKGASMLLGTAETKYTSWRQRVWSYEDDHHFTKISVSNTKKCEELQLSSHQFWIRRKLRVSRSPWSCKTRHKMLSLYIYGYRGLSDRSKLFCTCPSQTTGREALANALIAFVW